MSENQLFGDSGQEVVGVALVEDFGLVAATGCVHCEGFGVDVEPVEGFSFDVSVLHPVVDFSVICACQVYAYAAVFLFI